MMLARFGRQLASSAGEQQQLVSRVASTALQAAHAASSFAAAAPSAAAATAGLHQAKEPGASAAGEHGAGSLRARVAWGLAAGGGLMASGLITAQADSQVPAGSAPENPNMPFSETATHPLDYDPVTNEHTAKMTMARSAALEYYQSGRYSLAEAKFREALEEAQLGFDAKDPHIASAKNNLAEFYRNTAQYDKAETLYKEALTHLESIYGERHWLYVSAMHNLALCYESAGRLADAQATMEKVLALRLKMFGPRHFLYADSMFALGSIMLKRLGQQGSPTSASAAAPKKGWFGRGGGSSSPGVSEKQALGLMQEAVGLLEDAESVQVSVLMHWLDELSMQYRSRGKLQEAVSCVTKSMHYFGQDKGEAQAQASQLSDSLVSMLAEQGRTKEARDAAAACLTARMQLFGKELAVAQSMLRLSNLEAQLGKAGDAQAAVQHAANAASLAGELHAEYSKGGLMGRQPPERGLKRARAAFIQASALQCLSKLQQQQAPGSGAAAAAPGGPAAVSLRRAVSVLESSVTVAAEQLQHAASSAAQAAAAVPGGSMGGKAAVAAAAAQQVVEDMADVLLESQLLLFECLESLSGLLQQAAGSSPEAAKELAALQQKSQQLSQQLMA